MNRAVKITLSIIFIALLLLSLLILYASIHAAVIGSLEMIPTAEQIEKGRIAYGFIVILIVVIDVFLIVEFIKIIKSIRSK